MHFYRHAVFSPSGECRDRHVYYMGCLFPSFRSSFGLSPLDRPNHSVCVGTGSSTRQADNMPATFVIWVYLVSNITSEFHKPFFLFLCVFRVIHLAQINIRELFNKSMTSQNIVLLS